MSRVNVQATEMKQRRQSGLSLVELMIALLLGVIISTGVLNVFIASKRGYYEDEQMANMQENARFALRLLRSEISMAGYLGGEPGVAGVYSSTVVMGADCAAGWALKLIQENVTPPFLGGSLELANDVAANYSDKCVSNALNDGATGVVSDVLAVRRTAAAPANPLPADGSKSLYFVNQGCPAVAGVADPNPCLLYGGDVDAAAQISAAEAVALGSEDYFQASRYYAKSFYVRSFSSVAGDGIPCLVTAILAENGATPLMQSADCTVEGVQAMQLLFGLDTDGDRVPNKYVEDLDLNFGDINLVVSAKIYMLVRSTNEVQGHLDTKTYTVGTKQMGPFNDKFYRRVYNTSVRVPNMTKIGN